VAAGNSVGAAEETSPDWPAESGKRRHNAKVGNRPILRVMVPEP